MEMFTKPTHVPQVQAKYTTDSAQVRRVQVLWVRLKRNVDEVYLPSSEQGPMGSRYPTRPELFFKYPTRPDRKIENDWVLGNKISFWKQ